MIEQVKTYVIECDAMQNCPSNVTVHVKGSPPFPPDWTLIKVGPCGSTNYYRTEARCPLHQKETP